MFLVDTSPSMRTLRTVELPPGPNEEYRSTEMTNLQWALQFVKLKVQEMVCRFCHSLGRHQQSARYSMVAKQTNVVSSFLGPKVFIC